MELKDFIDFGAFFILLGLFLFIIFSQSMSMLHRVYLFLHLSFMHWSLLQFASQTTDDLSFKFLLVQTSYLVFSSISVIFYIFTLFIINKVDWCKTWKFRLSLLPVVAILILVVVNPNQLFIQDYIGPATDKVIGYGPLFKVLPIVSAFYVSIVFALLINKFRKLKNTTIIKRNISFTLIGLSIILVFSIIDLIYNIVLIDYFSSYFPFLTIGFLLSASYMTFRINRNNILNIISLAHRDVVNTMSVGILVIDRDNYIIEVNKHIYSMVELRVGDTLDFDYIIKSFPHNDWDRILKLYDKQSDNRFAVVSYELLVSKHPSRHSFIQCHPIIDRAETLLGYVYTVQDVTVMKNLVESTKRQNVLLQQRNSELILTQEELHTANKKLEQISITDSLTECYNRRYLIQFLEKQLPINIAKDISFSIVIIDLDYFKAINDRFGHFAGDYVLKLTANKLKSCIEPFDVLARFGGEEFVVYFHNVSKEDIQHKIEKLKKEIEKNEIWLEDSNETVSVTVSIGLVSIDQLDSLNGITTKNLQYDIMNLADFALYEAKNMGRNTIVKRDYVIDS